MRANEAVPGACRRARLRPERGAARSSRLPGADPAAAPAAPEPTPSPSTSAACAPRRRRRARRRSREPRRQVAAAQRPRRRAATRQGRRRRAEDRQIRAARRSDLAAFAEMPGRHRLRDADRRRLQGRAGRPAALRRRHSRLPADLRRRRRRRAGAGAGQRLRVLRRRLPGEPERAVGPARLPSSMPKAISKARTAADRSIQDSQRALENRDKDAAASLAREQSDFARRARRRLPAATTASGGCSSAPRG